MRVLCTFPGKFGDLLWALPTVRAISRRIGAPVDLLLARELQAIVPLLRSQPYLGAVATECAWVTRDTAPRSPRTPPLVAYPGYDRVIHLGYRDWPLPDVVRHTRETANEVCRLREEELTLDEPWIQAPDRTTYPFPALAIAFTDEHFELKFGLTTLVLESFARTYSDLGYRILTTPGSRWDGETWQPMRGKCPTDWSGYATAFTGASVVLTDCSAPHVLAVAMGKPVVVMEPNPHRHNPVFYPLGTIGQVELVVGTDGLPTFDARHVSDVLTRRLSEVS
jgi:hypothetical protein